MTDKFDQGRYRALMPAKAVRTECRNRSRKSRGPRCGIEQRSAIGDQQFARVLLCDDSLPVVVVVLVLWCLRAHFKAT